MNVTSVDWGLLTPILYPYFSFEHNLILSVCLSPLDGHGVHSQELFCHVCWQIIDLRTV